MSNRLPVLKTYLRFRVIIDSNLSDVKCELFDKSLTCVDISLPKLGYTYSVTPAVIRTTESSSEDKDGNCFPHRNRIFSICWHRIAKVRVMMLPLNPDDVHSRFTVILTISAGFTGG